MKLFRDQATILIILFNTDSYISGLALADYNRTSLKMLKKDIDYLNSICANYGCEIISKMGLGYRLLINDEQLYEKLKASVEKKYYNFLFYRNAQSEREHYIIRLLLEKECVSTQELVERCNYSESTIRRDIPNIKEKLKRYDLKLVNITNKGLAIVGDEWKHRLALVEERSIYNDFQRVYLNDDETTYFFNANSMIEIISKKLKEVLLKYQYIIPFNGLSDISQMILVTLKRKKYAKKLRKLNEIEKNDLLIEKEIISSLFNSIEDDEKFALEDIELDYLSVYLRGNKTIKFKEFMQLPIHQKVIDIVDGFFSFSVNYISFSNWDTTILRKDLCCEIASLIYRVQAGFHIQKRLVRQFVEDGITNLDLCSLLFQYLKENTNIDCTPEDVLKLYYCFTYFSRQRDEENKIKIAVISKSGYYVSRSLAVQYEKMTNYKIVEFVPKEYLKLKEMSKHDFNGFITDIDGFAEEYANYPVVELHYFRKTIEINKAIDTIINFLQMKNESLFSIESIHYVNTFKSLDEIEKYVRDNILKEKDDKDKFFKEFYKREKVYGSRRNNIMLMNTIGDYLNREFIEIISLSEPMFYKNDFINKILIFNTDYNSILKNNTTRKRVANLLHSYNMVFTGDLEMDYLNVEKIMYDTVM